MWVKVLIFNCFLLGFASSDNPSDCDITDISVDSWRGYLTKDFDDNQIDQHIFESPYNGNLNNLKCTCVTGACTIKDYIEFTSNETYFFVYTTHLLKDFDEDMLNSDEPNKNNVIYTCSMTCADDSQSSSVRIKSTIADYNDYSPQFAEGNRTYAVPSPMMPKSDFSLFGDAISATDMDFTNERITFDISPADFDAIITVDTTKRPSVFKPNFRANKILLLTEPKTYTITATDSGTYPGPLSNSITVTLVVNDDYVIDTPAFNYPSYSFQYEDDNRLTPLNGSINVKSNKVLTPNLSGELSDHFSTTYDGETSVISISVKTNIDTPESAFIILTLSATTDTTTSATIIIYFPNAPSEGTIKFNQPLYSGNYDDSTLLVTLVNDIEVTTSSTHAPTVFFRDGLDGFDPNAYFNITKDSDHYNVNVLNKLPDEILTKQKSLVMTLEADVDTSKGYATLVIDLPFKETTGSIQFDNPLYSGTYEIKDKTGTVTTDVIKIITDSSNDIDVSITNEFKDYFKPVYDSSTFEVTIKNISDVPDAVLKDLSNIAILLTATLKTTPPVSNSSVVNLKIINDDNDNSGGSLEFDSPLYNGTYVVKDDVTFSVDPITIKTDKPEIVVVSISNDYNKYFNTSFDKSTLAVTITKTNNIPAADLQNTITLVLSATLKDTKVSASSVVNIKVENESTPGSIEFDNALYSGTYEIKNKIGNVTTDTIKISTKNSHDVEVTITNDFKEYFKPDYDSSTSEVTINKTTDVPDTVLKDLSNIPILLIATLKTTTPVSTSSVVNLKIINDDNDNSGGSLEFDSPLYNGTYVVKDDVTFSVDPITIKTDKPEIVNVSISNNYNKYFSTSFDSSTLAVTITKTNNIPVADLQNTITLVLSATLKDTEVSASSVVNIKVENESTPGSIEFDNALYSGTYEIKNKIGNVTTDTIKISTKNSHDVEVTITNDFKEYFKPDYDSSTSEVTINKTTDVPDTVLKDLSNIPILLIATLKTTTPVSTSSVVNLKIINDDNDNSGGSLEFDSPLYSGTYVVKDDITFSVDLITIKTDKPEIVNVSISNDYNKYFSISFDSSTLAVTITKTSDVPTDELEDTITLVLLAILKDTKVSASSVVNIKVENENETTGSIQFDNPLYSGTYEIKDKTGTVTTDVIKIITDSSNDIDVSITNDFKDYFEPVYDSSTFEVTINNISDVPDAVLKDLSNIAILLTATLKTTLPVSTSSVVNLKIINDDNDNSGGSLEFDSPLYSGTYVVKDDITFSVDLITIKTDKPEIVNVSISNDYNKYFSISFDSSTLAVTITKTSDVPTDELEDTITLVLLAILKDTKVSASSVVNIKVENENVDSIEFDNLLYNGKYEIKNKEASIDVDNIKINTDKPNDVDISVTNTYKEYFNVTYTTTTSTVAIVKKADIPDSVLETISTVSIVLSASLSGTKLTANSIVNLRIINDDTPNPNMTGIISFDTFSNTGEYSIQNSQGVLTLDHIIGITTDRQNDEIETNITDDLGLNTYFTTSYSNQVFSVKLASNLPENIVSSYSFVSVTLTAIIKSTSQKANAVLTIKMDNDNAPDSLDFDSHLYNGVYEIKDSKVTVTVDPIKVVTDDTNNVDVSITNTYKDYFGVSYSSSSSLVTITITKNIPNDILQDISTVAILLSANLTRRQDTTATAGTVVNLRIVNDDTPAPDNNTGILKFDSVSHTAEYAIENNKGILKFNQTIGITTDRENEEIETSITDELGLSSDYFNSSYSNQKFVVTLLKDLPKEVFSSKSFISLTLEADIKNTGKNTNAVLTIKIDNDQNTDSGHISFESAVYAAVYEITDDIAAISDIDTISIDTDQDDGNVTVSLLNGYDQYFKSDYTNKKVTIALNSTTPSKTLRSMAYLPVVLLAEIKNSKLSARTVVNFKVIDHDNGDNTDNSTVRFPKLIYDGEYIIYIDDSIDFKFDNISLITERPENQINVTIENEYGYEKYFKASYSHFQVSISTNGVIPDHVMHEERYIALKLTATVTEISIQCEAVLNIRLILREDPLEQDATKYVIAISILVVFIILLVAGALILYYFRLRHLKYNKMTEEDYINHNSKVTFDKNALRNSGKTQRSSEIGNRRPTGFIFNPKGLDSDAASEARESTTDPPDVKERKKSVAFDENVEKLQLDAANDEDVEKSLDGESIEENDGD